MDAHFCLEDSYRRRPLPEIRVMRQTSLQYSYLDVTVLPNVLLSSQWASGRSHGTAIRKGGSRYSWQELVFPERVRIRRKPLSPFHVKLFHYGFVIAVAEGRYKTYCLHQLIIDGEMSWSTRKCPREHTQRSPTSWWSLQSQLVTATVCCER